MDYLAIEVEKHFEIVDCMWDIVDLKQLDIVDKMLDSEDIQNFEVVCSVMN